MLKNIREQFTRTGADVASGSLASVVTVRYWAAARAAVGVPQEVVAVNGPVTLMDLVDRIHVAHPDDRVESVIGVCSVLVDDLPVASRDPREVLVHPGATVEFLPPFAGG